MASRIAAEGESEIMDANDDLTEEIRSYLREFPHGGHIDPIQVTAEMAQRYGKTEKEVRLLIKGLAGSFGLTTSLD